MSSQKLACDQLKAALIYLKEADRLLEGIDEISFRLAHAQGLLPPSIWNVERSIKYMEM